MKVLLAENAGFCFGVKRAVDEAIKTQKQYNKKIRSHSFLFIFNINYFLFLLKKTGIGGKSSSIS